MKASARFAILVVIPLGCATEATDLPIGGNGNFAGAGGGAGMSAGGTSVSSAGTASPTAGSGTAGTTVVPEGGAAGSFGTAGTFSTAGTFVTAGTASGGSATAGSGGAAAGSSAGGSSAGGSSAGTGAAGAPAGGAGSGSGGTGVVTDYCDGQTKSPLPYVVNDGFQPSGWQGDFGAISVPTVAPNACDTRPANAKGTCSVWRFTPNATTPAWAGVAWSKVWDAQYTHPPVCLAAGATKISFQARGAAGGEMITFSGAGGPEVPFTLTNAWKKYEVSLAGIAYNSPDDGVDSGFFWKAGPNTPGNAPYTFFIDDIQIIK